MRRVGREAEREEAGRERREKRETGRMRSGGILGGGGRCIGEECCGSLELEVAAASASLPFWDSISKGSATQLLLTRPYICFL